jgi:hypothetical protein
MHVRRKQVPRTLTMRKQGLDDHWQAGNLNLNLPPSRTGSPLHTPRAAALSLRGAQELIMMLRFEVFGTASIVPTSMQAAAHLDLAAPCAVAASRSWMDAIQMGNLNATAAAAAHRTDAFVASQFAAGACAP